MSKRSPRWALAFIVAVGLAAAVMVACGGDDDDDGPPAAAPTQPPAATATQPAAATQAPAATATQPAAQGAPGATAVTIVDNSYGPNTISARVGQQLQVNLTNSGSFPHSFTIDGVVDSGVLNGGQTGQVQFTPTTAGQLTFYCTVHGRAVMSGTVNVTQ